MGPSVGGQVGTRGEPQTARRLWHLSEERRKKGGGSVSDKVRRAWGAHDGRKVLVLSWRFSLSVWESLGTHESGTVTMQI